MVTNPNRARAQAHRCFRPAASALALLSLGATGAAGCGVADDARAGEVVETSSAATAKKPTVAARFRYQDFDGDRKADPVYFRPSDGSWHIKPSTGAAEMIVPWGAADDIFVPAQYDGDGKTDIGLYRPSDETWWVLPTTSAGGYDATRFGTKTDLPVPGDYDGDGKTDRAYFRPSTREWHILPSAGGAEIVRRYGYATDRLVPGDYDGDGKTDIAVYRPKDPDFDNEGTWYFISSLTGERFSPAAVWGEEGDNPVPADYDGDGKTDFAVFRPHLAQWLIINSSTGAALDPPPVLGELPRYGYSADRLVPADYDGDDKADLAVFHPSGVWQYRSSRGGVDVNISFGTVGDTIPYHPYSSGCAGPNTNARLMAPYNCNKQDFVRMIESGWPYDGKRQKIVYAALKQAYRLPSPNQVENIWITALGDCDQTAETFYGASGAWCSEYVSYVYRSSGAIPTGTNLYERLRAVDNVDDMRAIFADRQSLAERGSTGWVQPGDYIAGVNGDGEHNGHSMMVFAVTDDGGQLYLSNGNSSFPINGTTHHCVVMSRHGLYQNGVLDPKFDAFGLIDNW
jgi:hypothetical protein